MTEAKIEYINKAGKESTVHCYYEKFNNQVIIQTFGSEHVFVKQLDKIISIEPLNKNHE